VIDRAADEPIAIGRVLRPHGLAGEVVVESWTDMPERFSPGLQVLLRGPGGERPALLSAVRPHQGRFLVLFEGTSTLEAAEALRDVELYIPFAVAEADRPDGYFFHFELEGMDVVDRSGAPLGVVESLVDVAGRSLLTVLTPRGAREVPFVEPIVVSVDGAARRVVLDPPSGLLD